MRPATVQTPDSVCNQPPSRRRQALQNSGAYSWCIGGADMPVQVRGPSMDVCPCNPQEFVSTTTAAATARLAPSLSTHRVQAHQNNATSSHTFPSKGIPLPCSCETSIAFPALHINKEVQEPRKYKSPPEWKRDQTLRCGSSLWHSRDKTDYNTSHRPRRPHVHMVVSYEVSRPRNIL